MDWQIPVALLGILVAYGLIAWYVKSRRIREDIVTFYGPVMAIKTSRIGLFDRFTPLATILRIYGSIGIAMVAAVSVAMTLLVLYAFRMEVVSPPPPEGIFALTNVLALPGVNQFIPFTIPVILAIALTIAIHEFGHGILCRVEGILVRSMGVLLFVIPIGFFVEPDEEDLERTPPVPKSRMFGAGIANNIVAGFASFGLLFLLLGMLVPIQAPVVYKLVEGSPAYNASVPLGSAVLALDGRNVTSVNDLSLILSGTRPGDTLRLTVLPAEVLRDLAPGSTGPEGVTYTLNLTSFPGRTTGYSGIFYLDPGGTLGAMKGLASPVGFLLLSFLPVDILPMYNQYPQLHLLFIDSPDTAFYRVPFPLFWAVVHFFFWCGWFNFMVGTFNALPMVPFDGGFIMKEGVEGFARRIGRPRIANPLVLAISLLILVLLILILAIPYIAKALTMVSPGM